MHSESETAEAVPRSASREHLTALRDPPEISAKWMEVT